MSSRSVKALRERYGTSGNKSDRSDAYVLADCLRTDGHRWRSLKVDSPATVTLRSHVRARKDLVEHRVAVANQLRAHLRSCSPAQSACSETSKARSRCAPGMVPVRKQCCVALGEAAQLLAARKRILRPQTSRRALPATC